MAVHPYYPTKVTFAGISKSSDETGSCYGNNPVMQLVSVDMSLANSNNNLATGSQLLSRDETYRAPSGANGQLKYYNYCTASFDSTYTIAHEAVVSYDANFTAWHVDLWDSNLTRYFFTASITGITGEDTIVSSFSNDYSSDDVTTSLGYGGTATVEFTRKIPLQQVTSFPRVNLAPTRSTVINPAWLGANSGTLPPEMEMSPISERVSLAPTTRGSIIPPYASSPHLYPMVIQPYTGWSGGALFIFPGTTPQIATNIATGRINLAPTRNVGRPYIVPPSITIPPPKIQPTATVSVSGGTLVNPTITNSGAGYVQPPTISISGGGGTGGQLSGSISSGGALTGISTISGGSGYTGAPTVSISSPSGTATVTPITGSGGGVTGVSIPLSGTGYVGGPLISFSGASGEPTYTGTGLVSTGGALTGTTLPTGMTGMTNPSGTVNPPGIDPCAELWSMSGLGMANYALWQSNPKWAGFWETELINRYGAEWTKYTGCLSGEGYTEPPVITYPPPPTLTGGPPLPPVVPPVVPPPVVFPRPPTGSGTKPEVECGGVVEVTGVDPAPSPGRNGNFINSNMNNQLMRFPVRNFIHNPWGVSLHRNHHRKYELSSWGRNATMEIHGSSHIRKGIQFQFSPEPLFASCFKYNAISQTGLGYAGANLTGGTTGSGWSIGEQEVSGIDNERVKKEMGCHLYNEGAPPDYCWEMADYDNFSGASEDQCRDFLRKLNIIEQDINTGDYIFLKLIGMISMSGSVWDSSGNHYCLAYCNKSVPSGIANHNGIANNYLIVTSYSGYDARYLAKIHEWDAW